MNSFSLKNNNASNSRVLRVVLDEPRLFVEQSIGSAMVRGEIIVNFSTDTYIQGPIELVFEGIQRFYPWPEIMKGSSVNSSIETKLQVTELSLLPPNTKGLMPAGIQRFPFEFPIPASLPTSVDIPNRLNIFYRVTATLRRSQRASPSEQQHDHSSLNIFEWAKRNSMFKKKFTACQAMRIVRAMESIVSSGLPNSEALIRSQQQQLQQYRRTSSDSSRQVDNDNSSIQTNSSGGSNGSHILAAVQNDDTLVSEIDNQLPWNRRNLDGYQPAATTFDEQPDLLAFSLAGRTASNLTAANYDDVQGIRYKIGVDRTAIAIGTSVGIELMIEPTIATAVIHSVLLKITETRTYAMKVPGDYTRGSNTPETKRAKEAARMILKWAYGYKIEEDNDDNEDEGQIEGSGGVHTTKSMKKLTESYVRQRDEQSKYRAYFDPPQPGDSTSKSFLNKALLVSYHDKDSPPTECSSSTTLRSNGSKKKLPDCPTARVMADNASNTAHEMINLKELKQTVRVGEYFGGRFVLPVPDCSNILNPTIECESINIHHWLQLVVTINCNGKLFDLTLNSPVRMLDCRVVAADDECQTILPPPPSYNQTSTSPSSSAIGATQNWWPQGTFWEQREIITSVDGWGSCVPCPCELRKLKKQGLLESSKNSIKNNDFSKSSSLSINNKNRAYHTNTTLLHHRTNNQPTGTTTTAQEYSSMAGNCLPSQIPEWGPPPCYSEN